jgi:hypothetical protein
MRRWRLNITILGPPPPVVGVGYARAAATAHRVSLFSSCFVCAFLFIIWSREALGERDQDLIFWSQQLVIVILDAGRHLVLVPPVRHSAPTTGCWAGGRGAGTTTHRDFPFFCVNKKHVPFILFPRIG